HLCLGRATGRTCGEYDAFIPAIEGPAVALHCGRCRTQDDRGRRELGEADRRIAGLAPWRAVPRVWRRALLVDEAAPDVGERCDDSEPRADDDVDVPSADTPPFVGALT